MANMPTNHQVLQASADGYTWQSLFQKAESGRLRGVHHIKGGTFHATKTVHGGFQVCWFDGGLSAGWVVVRLADRRAVLVVPGDMDDEQAAEDAAWCCRKIAVDPGSGSRTYAMLSVAHENREEIVERIENGLTVMNADGETFMPTVLAAGMTYGAYRCLLRRIG